MSSTYKHTLERNARLDVLHSRGLINVTNSDALNASHNTIANVFDRDNDVLNYFLMDNDKVSFESHYKFDSNINKYFKQIIN